MNDDIKRATQDGPTEQKPITVYNKEGELLSYCTLKRANQMVYRKKAKWVGYQRVRLLFTSEDMKALKKFIRRRDGNVCYICQKPILDEGLISVDHIIPEGQGGEDSEENLAICCKPCNELKANRNPEEFTLCLAAWIMYHKLWYTMKNRRNHNASTSEKHIRAHGKPERRPYGSPATHDHDTRVHARLQHGKPGRP